MRRIAAAFGLALLAGLAHGAGATHVVVIDGVKYEPASLRVKRGDTIVWVNKDPFPHTVTAKGQFDSGSIGVDRRWTLVARKAGHFEYLCSLHPNMQGSFDVE